MSIGAADEPVVIEDPVTPPLRGNSGSDRLPRPSRPVATRLGFELLIVFAGVTSAFLVEDWRSSRERHQRGAQLYEAVARELEAFAVVGQQMHDSMAIGWAGWIRAHDAGERPAPYYYFLPDFERPPMDAWEATISSGGVNLIEPQLFLDLAVTYGRLRTLVDRYDRLTTFAESEILPRAGGGPEAFYLPGSGSLRPQYQAYSDRRLAVQEEFRRDVEAVNALLPRLRAAIAEY